MKTKPVKVISKNLVSPPQSADRLTTVNASGLVLFRGPVVVYCDNQAVTHKKCGLSRDYVPVTLHREQSVKKKYQQDATI